MAEPTTGSWPEARHRLQAGQPLGWPHLSVHLLRSVRCLLAGLLLLAHRNGEQLSGTRRHSGCHIQDLPGNWRCHGMESQRAEVSGSDAIGHVLGSLHWRAYRFDPGRVDGEGHDATRG